MKRIIIDCLILLLIGGVAIQAQASGAPVITQQPLTQQMVDTGQSVTLTVGVASTKLTSSYQWWTYTYNDDTNIWSWASIPGATKASYGFLATVSTDTNLAETNTYQYYCVVTNSLGSTTSSVAIVMVNTAPVYAPLPTSPSYAIVQRNTGNDMAAIQAAINQEAGTGGTVYFPLGTYMINTPGINLPNNITLRLDPGAILQANSTASYAILNIVNVSNVYVIGGSLIGYSSTSNGSGINIEGSTNVVVEGVRSSASVTSFYVGASTSNPNSANITFGSVIANSKGNQGILIASANGVLINNSFFAHTYGTASQCGANIQPDPGNTVNNVQITNSLLIGNSEEGICISPGTGFVTDVTVSGNIISGNFGGINLNNTNALIVTNNIINDSNVGGIYLEPGSTDNDITGNTITVSGTAIGNGIIDHSAHGIIDSSGNTTNNIQNNTCNGTICTPIIPLAYYTLTLNESGNGTVSESPDTATYLAGSQVDLTATPSVGYLFSGWSGGASGNTNPLVLTMNANTSVTANFNVQTEAITASAGDGGTITPFGAVSVNYEASQTFIVIPASGYTAQLTVDGSAATLINNTYVFNNVTTSHTIAANFTLTDVITPTAIVQAEAVTVTSTGTGGTVSPSGKMYVNYGMSQTFTVTPGVGYAAILEVDGSTVTLNNNTYTLTNVTTTHKVVAKFHSQNETVTASAGVGGTITPSGSMSVDYGTSQEFIIDPNTGYTAVLTDNGVSKPLKKNEYDLNNIKDTHTIEVSFIKNN